MQINIVIGGRGQGEGSSNGSNELSEILIEAIDEAGYSTKQNRVHFYPWWANWEEVAQNLHLLRLRYKLEKDQFGINVYAFSRGVGHGVVRLSGAAPWYSYKRLLGKSGLQRFGLTIDSAVYCDGIYHHWYSIGGFQWRSVVGSHRIKLPRQAGRTIHAFRQEISRPMGMELIVEPPSKIVGGKAEVLEYEHVEMDNAPEYHKKCVEVMLESARRFVPSSKKQETPSPDNKPQVMSPLELMDSKLAEVETSKKN